MAKKDDKKPSVAVYKVAEGKSLSCRRGILSEGEEVRIEDFQTNGEAALPELAEAGYLVVSEAEKADEKAADE